MSGGKKPIVKQSRKGKAAVPPKPPVKPKPKASKKDKT